MGIKNMKNVIVKTLVVCSALLVASCGSMPKHNEIRSDDQPTLFIEDNGIGSQLFIDGNNMGVVGGDNQLFNISTGNHEIKIVKRNGQVIEQIIFVQGNTRREISVPK